MPSVDPSAKVMSCTSPRWRRPRASRRCRLAASTRHSTLQSFSVRSKTRFAVISTITSRPCRWRPSDRTSLARHDSTRTREFAVDDLAPPAIAALSVGIVGLAACSLAMSHVLPRTRRRLWRRRHRPAWSTSAMKRSSRRVVTGASALERHADGRPPARLSALQPDVLRQDRERLGVADSRRAIEQALDTDPTRLAEVVQRMIAEDQPDS